MRIIAGDYKGRKLKTPQDKSIRPTPDKVREALFSMLMERMEGSICCDLFAGTGALGLEALSRGAAFCTFCDNSRDSVKLLQENIDHVGAGEKSRVVAGHYEKALSSLTEPVDLFFLDPPYESGLLEKAMGSISRRGLLAEDGIIVAEHRKDLELPDTLAGFTKVREKRYGIVVLSLFM